MIQNRFVLFAFSDTYILKTLLWRERYLRMTTEERVRSLHARMNDLIRARERRKTGAIGGACIVLAACLILLLFGGGMSCIGGPAGMYSGASMLFGNAGGYVLVALIAFTAAVIITVLCIRWRSKNDRRKTSSEQNHYEKQCKEDEE